MFQELLSALEESLFMIFATSLATLLLGLPLSVLQIFSMRKTTFASKLLNAILPLAGSIPYIIILITFIPFTQWLIGRHSSFFAIIPLTLAALPLFVKFCTEALNKVPKDLTEMAIGLGATPKQIILKVIIPEALPNIIHGFSQLLIQIIGLTVVVGVLGAGGMGKLLVIRGYQHYEASYVAAILGTVVTLVIMVQAIGHFLAFGSFKTK